jgi:hypothetical protein
VPPSTRMQRYVPQEQLILARKQRLFGVMMDAPVLLLCHAAVFCDPRPPNPLNVNSRCDVLSHPCAVD